MNRVHDDIDVPRLLHNLLKELGWTHGEITSSLVHQALGQVRLLKKQAAHLATVTAALNEACDIAADLNGSDGWQPTNERIADLRKAGAK